MRKILLVEDSVTWEDEFKKKMKAVFAESSEIVVYNRVNDAVSSFQEPSFFDAFDLAVVDLELGAAESSSLSDFLGRDKILPEIRRLACWLPVLLMSRHVTGEAIVLAQLTPYDFDAVLPKSLISDRTASPYLWSELRWRTALSRIARLTGRTTDSLETCLKRKLNLSFGQEIIDQLLSLVPDEKEMKETLQELVSLMDFGGERIVLDKVIQGYSGLVVIKASCQRGGTTTQWLLKIGKSITKLDRELEAHRNMFLAGFQRRMYVPVIWWRPVVWKGLGIIAYEFEKETTTFFEAYESERPKEAFLKLLPALEYLYASCTKQLMIPRDIAFRVLKPPSGVDTAKYSQIQVLLTKQKCNSLDKSVTIKVGTEHGDFHSRNILVGPHGPTLIDFSHYESHDGIPLRDLAKLLVDLWAFNRLSISAAELVQGTVLRHKDLAEIVPPFILDPLGGPTDDEKRLFGWLVRCQLYNYTGYDDVPKERREEAIELLSSE